MVRLARKLVTDKADDHSAVALHRAGVKAHLYEAAVSGMVGLDHIYTWLMSF